MFLCFGRSRRRELPSPSSCLFTRSPRRRSATSRFSKDIFHGLPPVFIVAPPVVCAFAYLFSNGFPFTRTLPRQTFARQNNNFPRMRSKSRLFVLSSPSSWWCDETKETREDDGCFSPNGNAVTYPLCAPMRTYARCTSSMVVDTYSVEEGDELTRGLGIEERSLLKSVGKKKRIRYFTQVVYDK